MEEKQLLDIIAEYTTYSVDALNEDMDFSEDLGIDSLDLAQIIMAVEEAYDIELEEEVLENVKTVGDAIQMVRDSEQ